MLNFNISDAVFGQFFDVATRCFAGTKYLPKFTQSPSKAFPNPTPVGFNSPYVRILYRSKSGDVWNFFKRLKN